MSKSTKYKHLVVIGRVPEDDEDSIYSFQNLTEPQARKAFERAIYGDLADEKSPAQTRRDWGISCYINLILTSDTEIQCLHYGYGG